MSTHTPGPWSLRLSNDARIDDKVISANGTTVFRGSIGNTDDAALIAAAPAMLEALKTILNISLMDKGNWAITIEKEAHAAIARATGGGSCGN